MINDFAIVSAKITGTSFSTWWHVSIWVPKKTKSSGNNWSLAATYFDDPYKEGHQRQDDYYEYILRGMGYQVSSDTHFYICNVKEVNQGFHGKMIFDEVLIH